MTDQLALLELPVAPKLTWRQQAVLDAVTRAHPESLESSEAGAILHEMKEGRWRHSRDDRCRFCGQDGKAVLEALRTKGLVTYRRRKGLEDGGWVLAGCQRPAPRGMLAATDPIPF